MDHRGHSLGYVNAGVDQRLNDERNDLPRAGHRCYCLWQSSLYRVEDESKHPDPFQVSLPGSEGGVYGWFSTDTAGKGFHAEYGGPIKGWRPIS